MNKHIGTTLDSLFVELSEAEDVALLTQKKLLAENIRRAMAKKGVTSAGLAIAIKTSRTVVHRLLDPNDTGVTLATICKAENALHVKLVRVIPATHRTRSHRASPPA